MVLVLFKLPVVHIRIFARTVFHSLIKLLPRGKWDWGKTYWLITFSDFALIESYWPFWIVHLSFPRYLCPCWVSCTLYWFVRWVVFFKYPFRTVDGTLWTCTFFCLRASLLFFILNAVIGSAIGKFGAIRSSLLVLVSLDEYVILVSIFWQFSV